MQDRRSNSASYLGVISSVPHHPVNGRTLTDDVMDVFLPILTNGKVTRDNVGPHNDLLAAFPYLGPPHKVRSAESSRGPI